jgi:uncharacterized protein
MAGAAFADRAGAKQGENLAGSAAGGNSGQMIDGMMVIDAHCHIGESPAMRNGVQRFTADDLLARMDRNGIDRAIVCSLIFPLWERDDFIRGNDLVIAAAREHADRLRGLVVVNPRHGAFAEDEARRGLAAGLVGIKVQPAMHGFWPIDGALMDPLMAIAANSGVPVITHSDFNAKCCTPYQVVRLAKRWPSVKIVLLHLGQDAESVGHTPDIVADAPNVVVETSNTPDYPYAVYVNPVRKLGADRVLFGSDGPVVSVEANLAKLRAAVETYGLTRDEMRGVLGVSAARFFSWEN